MKPASGITALFIILACAAPLNAEQPQTKLQATQAQLKASQQRYAALQKDASGLGVELTKLQTTLVDLAEAARKRELRLLELEDRQASLNAEIKASQADLDSRRGEVAELLQSLIRISRTPPEAVIAMPGELRHTLQAADLLQATTRRLHAQAHELTSRLDRLQESKEKLEKNRIALADEKQKTEAVRKTLAMQVDERKKLFAQLGRQQAQEKGKIATLTRQSQNLQQLIAKLEQERSRQILAEEKMAAAPKAKPLSSVASSSVPEEKTPSPQPTQKFASFSAARGNLSLPVAGHVTSRYGQRLGKSEISQGMTIVSREGNAILAPYAGEVVFTGPFLDYGQMVILRYDGNYHLLLAGFSKIDCVNGQRVVAGEPLGRAKAKLYLELRQNGKPTNPSPWFG